MKAIETVYNGYRFRSRLEARWAVFFDEVGIRYRYEAEGFELSDGTRYLPDFYLPDFKYWVEVKGVLDEESREKIDKFRDELTNGEILWLVGEIPDVDEIENNLYAGDFWSIGLHHGWDSPYIPCICPACGKVGIEFDGRGWRVCNHFKDLAEEKMLYCAENDVYIDENGKERPFKYPEWAGWRIDDKGYSGHHPIIINAYNKAKQARFEYGEMPNTKTKIKFFSIQDVCGNNIIIRHIDGDDTFYTLSHPKDKETTLAYDAVCVLILSVCGKEKMDEFIEWSITGMRYY